MKDIKLYITENCNLKCSYCFVNKENAKSMSEDVLQETIKFLNNIDDEICLTFFGGEPLLEFHKIKKIVKSMEPREEPIKYIVNTNMTLLNDEMLEYFKEKDFTILYSIDGNKQSHDKHRVKLNGEGTYDQIISKCNLIHKYNINSACKIVVTPETVAELFENVEFLDGISVKALYIDIARQIPWQQQELFILNNEFEKISNWIVDKKINLINFKKQNGKKTYCGCGLTQLAIYVDGCIYPCYRLIYDKFLLGNVKEKLNHGSVESFLNKINEGLNKCRINPNKHCSEFCAAVNYEVNDDIVKKANINCDFHIISEKSREKYQQSLIRKYLKSII